MNKAIINGEILNVTEFEDALPTEGVILPLGIITYYALISDNKIYKVANGESTGPASVIYEYEEIGDYVDEDNILLDSDTLFIKVPKDYKELYERILHLLVEYGEEALKDCKTTCKDRNINIIDCYNMFLSLLAANELGKETLANVLYEHITYKLDFYFSNK